MVLVASALAEGGMGDGGRVVKWLPYHRFVIHSPLPPPQAQQKMAAQVQPRKIFRFGGPDNDRQFQGELTADSFSVTRIIGYRNSFLPLVEGRFESAAGGSAITITMRPLIFVIAFMTVWFSLALSFSAAAFTSTLVGLIPVGMLVFGYALVMIPFWIEAKKQERVLREIFQARAPPVELVS